MFISNAVVRPLMFDGGDDTGLRIGPVHDADPHRFAQRGVAAIGGDRQTRLKALAVA